MGCRGGHEHDQLKYGLSLYISREKRPSNMETSFPAFSPTRPTRRVVRREPREPGCQTRHNDLFSHYNLILRKLKEKCPKGARKYTKRIVLIPPGHPTILLKSNLFNIAAVSVKGLLFKKNICTLDSH